MADAKSSLERRLIERANHAMSRVGIDLPDAPTVAAVMREAAEEIRRLRAACEAGEQYHLRPTAHGYARWADANRNALTGLGPRGEGEGNG